MVAYVHIEYSTHQFSEESKGVESTSTPCGTEKSVVLRGLINSMIELKLSTIYLHFYINFVKNLLGYRFTYNSVIKFRVTWLKIRMNTRSTLIHRSTGKPQYNLNQRLAGNGTQFIMYKHCNAIILSISYLRHVSVLTYLLVNKYF